ncbi:MAG: hypothetical protein ABJA79_03255 [Parafilimonas sp.]
MKYLFFSLAMLVATSTPLFSQSNDERAVRQTLEEIQTAFRNNDSGAARRFLSDDYILYCSMIHAYKDYRLVSIESGQFKYDPFKDENVNVFS